MDDLVKAFIEKSRTAMQAKEAQRVNDYLISLGLYREIGEREYTTAANPGEEYKYYDKEKKQWYKVEKIPIQVSEEDLAELYAITDMTENINESNKLHEHIVSIKEDIHFFKIITIIYIFISIIMGIIFAISLS